MQPSTMSTLRLVLLAVVCLLPVLECKDSEYNSCTGKPLELNFLLDTRVNPDTELLTNRLWFIIDVLKKFDIGYDKLRTIVVPYDGQGVDPDDIIQNYDTATELHDMIRQINPGTDANGKGMSMTSYALQLYTQFFEDVVRKDVRHIVVVITASKSLHASLTRNNAIIARRHGMDLFAIGIGSSVGSQELFDITADRRKTLFVANDDRLNLEVDHFVNEMCKTDFTPRCEYKPIDIVFMIDTSKSIRKEIFRTKKTFIRNLLEKFSINHRHMRVGAFTFARHPYTNPVEIVQFKKYEDPERYKTDVLTEIMALPRNKSGNWNTNIYGALTFLLEKYKPQFRPEAKHVGVILSDGKDRGGRNARSAIPLLRNANITMYSILIGSHTTRSRKLLHDIAGHESRVMAIKNPSALDTLTDRLSNQICPIKEERVTTERPNPETTDVTTAETTQAAEKTPTVSNLGAEKAKTTQGPTAPSAAETVEVEKKTTGRPRAETTKVTTAETTQAAEEQTPTASNTGAESAKTTQGPTAPSARETVEVEKTTERPRAETTQAAEEQTSEASNLAVKGTQEQSAQIIQEPTVPTAETPGEESYQETGMETTQGPSVGTSEPATTTPLC